METPWQRRTATPRPRPKAARPCVGVAAGAAFSATLTPHAAGSTARPAAARSSSARVRIFICVPPRRVGSRAAARPLVPALAASPALFAAGPRIPPPLRRSWCRLPEGPKTGGGMGSGARAPDALECLDAVRVVLDDLLAARTPKRIATSTCPAEAQPLVEAVNRLVGFMEELAVFVLPLAHGELAAPRPSPTTPWRCRSSSCTLISAGSRGRPARSPAATMVSAPTSWATSRGRSTPWCSSWPSGSSASPRRSSAARKWRRPSSANATCWSPDRWSPSAGTSTTRARCSTCPLTSPSSGTAPTSSSAEAGPTTA